MPDYTSAQIALGSLTWSIHYKQKWRHTVTAVILSISISVRSSALFVAIKMRYSILHRPISLRDWSSPSVIIERAKPKSSNVSYDKPSLKKPFDER